MVLARRIGYVFVLAALLLAVPAAAQAKFTRGATASTSVSTDVLDAPASASAAKQCGILSPYAAVTWAAATDNYATGYTVTMTRVSTGATTTTAVTGRSTTSATIQVPFNAAVTFTVMTTYRNWTSAQTASTASVTCGYLG